MRNLVNQAVEYLANGAKSLVSNVVNDIKNLSPAAIPGVGYFIAASEKVPDITQGEQVAVAAAFGVATKLVVDMGQVAGYRAFQAADYIAQPDEQTSRVGCFASTFSGGMAGAVMATTLAFNTINDRPQDITEFFEHLENNAEQTEIMPSQGQ